MLAVAFVVRLEVAVVAGVMIRAGFVVADIAYSRGILTVMVVVFPEVMIGAVVGSAMAVVWAAFSVVTARVVLRGSVPVPVVRFVAPATVRTASMVAVFGETMARACVSVSMAWAALKAGITGISRNRESVGISAMEAAVIGVGWWG